MTRFNDCIDCGNPISLGENLCPSCVSNATERDHAEIAALRAQVAEAERRRDETRESIEYPWCPECRVTATRCDEDRCCLSCGADLIEQSARAETAEAALAEATRLIDSIAISGAFSGIERDVLLGIIARCRDFLAKHGKPCGTVLGMPVRFDESVPPGEIRMDAPCGTCGGKGTVFAHPDYTSVRDATKPCPDCGGGA